LRLFLEERKHINKSKAVIDDLDMLLPASEGDFKEKEVESKGKRQSTSYGGNIFWIIYTLIN